MNHNRNRQRSFVRWPDARTMNAYWAAQTHYSSRDSLWPLTVNNVITSQRRRRGK